MSDDLPPSEVVTEVVRVVDEADPPPPKKPAEAADKPKEAKDGKADKAAKPTGRWSFERVKEMFSRYGAVAFVTWFSIFGLTWLGFAAAISFGFEVDGAVGGAGTAGAAYIATQLVKPIRIVATVALTPVVAAVWQRLRPRREALAAIEQTKKADDAD